MRDKIRKIVIDGVLETKDLTETIDQLFDLLVVVGQSEQCEHEYGKMQESFRRGSSFGTRKCLKCGKRKC